MPATSWIAVKMLVGDRAKYYGVIAGVAFAALLMAQQAAVFWGMLMRSTSTLQDVVDAPIWVMDASDEYIDETRGMPDIDLYRIRGVPGVASAVPFFKGTGRLKLEDGGYQQAIVLGLDDATLVGAPRHVLLGELSDLRQPDAVLMDESGYHYLWPDRPLETGGIFEMNDRRVKVVGICKASETFQTFPILYTCYTQALQLVPQERKSMPFVLVRPVTGVDDAEVCRRILEATGRKALTRADFARQTIRFYLRRTRIAINFGITITLGFIVGCAIAGQTIYSFTVENLAQFGTLKAMGVTNRRLLGMVLTQGLLVGALGYCVGVGLAALSGQLSLVFNRLAFNMPWQIPAATAVAVGVIILVSSVFSIYKVLVLEPAIVFRS